MSKFTKQSDQNKGKHGGDNWLILEINILQYDVLLVVDMINLIVSIPRERYYNIWCLFVESAIMR